MRNASICYDTCHGHTLKLARRIATQMRQRGVDITLHSIRSNESPSFAKIDAVVIVASIHTGHHSKYLRRFVLDHKLALACIPSLFLSVSLSAAGDPAQRDNAVLVMDDFLDETSWYPTMRDIVAGELAYRRYTWPTRLLMQWIAWRAGGDSNVRKNHVYTDWQRLEKRVDGFVDALAGTDAKEESTNTNGEALEQTTS